MRRQSTPRPYGRGGMRVCPRRKPKGACGSPNRGFLTPRSPGRGEMALIECRECHSQISSGAESCPTCGQPLKSKKNPFGLGFFLATMVVAVALLAVLLDTRENSSTAQLPKVGEVRYVKAGTLGCFDRKYLERMAKFSGQGDRDAVASLLFQTISSHACRALDENSTLYVEEIGSSGFVCGRPRGEATCLWIPGVLISASTMSGASAPR